MCINYLMIIKNFLFHHPEVKSINTDKIPASHFKGFRILEPSADCLSSDYLYLWNQQEIILEKETIHILYVLPQNSLPLSDAFITSKQIVLYTDLNLFSVVNEFWDIYNAFRDWERELDIAIIQAKHIQYLIDISENFINHPIMLFDTSLSMLAHTIHHVPTHPNDDIFSTILEKGYLPSDDIFKFMEKDTFLNMTKTEFEIQQDLFQTDKWNIYQMLYVMGQPVAHFTILLIEPEQIDYIKDLVRILGSKIQMFIERNMTASINKKQIFDYYFAKLIETPSLPQEDIAERFSCIGIPPHGYFKLLGLSMPSKNTIPTTFIISNIQQLSKKVYVTEYREKIYILYTESELEKEDYIYKTFNIFETAVKNILTKYSIFIGSSLWFHKIEQIKISYLQANAVLKYLSTQTPFGEYTNYRLLHMLDICSKTIPIDTLVHPKLTELTNSTQKREQEHLIVLKAYMKQNCKLKETAQILHMHRNSVLYHIQEIKRLYDIDLDNYEERLDLMLSLAIKQ